MNTRLLKQERHRVEQQRAIRDAFNQQEMQEGGGSPKTGTGLSAATPHAEDGAPGSTLLSLPRVTKNRDVSTVHEHNGQTLRLHTYVHGGAPKTSCDILNITGAFAGRWTWEYPHAFGYMLGFDVKATTKTLLQCHEAAIQRLKTL